MKRITSMAVIILLLVNTAAFGGESDSVWTESRTVNYTGGSREVSVVWTNLNNPKIRVDTVLADGEIGQVATLKEIVESSNDTDATAIAGINGSFFAAYTDLQPLGTLIQDGVVQQISNSGSVIAIEEGNQVKIDPLYIAIAGGTQNQWEYPYNWYAWNINHYYPDPSAVMLFNNRYEGPKPEHDFTGIVVDKQMVKVIEVGTFEIPDEGFLILSKNQGIIDKFQVGHQAAYDMGHYENDYTTSSHNGTSLDYNNVRSAVGAGPTLVKDGVIVLDGASEGFTEDKILINPAQRSLIGVTKDNLMAMVSVPGVTMYQLAEIALDLGLTQAINLDGGASSGVYSEGTYHTMPGREVSNALVIRELKENPIRIKLNGSYLFFDTEPYANKEYQRTLVPLRGMAEAVGATVGWDGETSSIIINRYDTTIKLKVGSDEIEVNGVKETLPIPLTVRDQRTYVPTRFIEHLGGTVGWDGEVILEVDMVSDIEAEALEAYKAKSYEAAAKAYKKVLELDKNNTNAMKQLGLIYGAYLSDQPSAIKYYEMALAIEKDNSAVMNSLAWSYYSSGKTDEAIALFKKVSTYQGKVAGGYYGMGLCYAAWAVQDETNAKKYFQLALDNGLTGQSATTAQDYINKH